jgi:transposase
MDEHAPEPTRFVALDVHKHYVMVGAVDGRQTMVLPPLRVPLGEFPTWAQEHLGAMDAVVLEATANAWHLYDLLTPLVAAVTVAHAGVIKLIAQARVKTDRRDTLHLARLLAARMIPAVWVPPVEVRELRGLVSHRRRLVAQRTQARNRLHGVLHRHQIVPPDGTLFSRAQRAWWASLSLSAAERLRVRQDLAVLDTLDGLIAEVEAELGRLSTTAPWAEHVPYLVQLSGIGVLAAMTLLAGIGDIARFPTAKNLVGYAGLGAGVHDTGQTHQGGRITKQGRRELRGCMTEAAWVAVERHSHWKAVFARLSARMSAQKAIVAIARKLLVVVWHVLTDREADHRGEAPAMARALWLWQARCGTVPGSKRPLRQLVGYEVQRWGLDVSQITSATGRPLMVLTPPPPRPG